MRLWTIQGIEIYEQLVKEGVTYCTKPAWGDEDNFVYAYHWMAEQMRKRIGEPPIEGIEYPLWAWYHQATFWALYPENIVSVEFLERNGDIVKQIKYSNIKK